MSRTIKPSLFLVLLLLAGAASAQSQKWKFLVYGDTRGTNSTSDQINATILAELARATTNTSPKPAFVLVPGDLSIRARSRPFKAGPISWRPSMRPALRSIR